MRYSTVVAAIVVALAATACGDSRDVTEDQRNIRVSFAKVNERLAAQDTVGACRWMAPIARRQVGSLGHQVPDGCPQDVRAFLKSIDEDPTSRPVDPRIARIDLDGDRATVIARYDARHSGAFVFVDDDGTWKLASVFSTTGTSPPDLGTPVPDLPSIGAAASGPPPPSAPVTASIGTQACPAVQTVKLDADGGCLLTATEAPVDLRLKTLFGDASFAKCTLSFSMLIDEAGRITTDDLAVGYQGGGPCGDIQRCRSANAKGPEPWNYKDPWRGRLRETPNGDLTAELDACFDTCAGRLQGRLTMSLSRDKRGWVLRADDAAVGRSGLSMSGKWRLITDRLRIASDSDSPT